MQGWAPPPTSVSGTADPFLTHLPLQLAHIQGLIEKDLSEPYSIYTYRFFLNNWPKLCFMAWSEEKECVGTIVCKLERHRKGKRRGYIAMLAVKASHRKRGIGSSLVKRAVAQMKEDKADLVRDMTMRVRAPELRIPPSSLTRAQPLG